jgi:hypothetical protein
MSEEAFRIADGPYVGESTPFLPIPGGMPPVCTREPIATPTRNSARALANLALNSQGRNAVPLEQD